MYVTSSTNGIALIFSDIDDLKDIIKGITYPPLLIISHESVTREDLAECEEFAGFTGLTLRDI